MTLLSARHRLLLRKFRNNRTAVAGLIVFGLLLACVLAGPLVWQVGIADIDFTSRLEGPSAAHPLGTDDMGQDLLARLLFGGRISLAVGIAAALVATMIGGPIGACAAYGPRWADLALMWFTDLFLSLPNLPLLVVVIYFFREAMRATFGVTLGTFFLIVLVADRTHPAIGPLVAQHGIVAGAGPVGSLQVDLDAGTAWCPQGRAARLHHSEVLPAGLPRNFGPKVGALSRGRFDTVSRNWRQTTRCWSLRQSRCCGGGHPFDRNLQDWNAMSVKAQSMDLTR